jgi:TRAP-type C4-dicarboxylate transport system permease small subunit
MKALSGAVVWLSRFFAYIGAAAVVGMMLLICLYVIMREVFRISWNPTPEIVARYFMVGIAFLPLSWLELKKQMIQVELIEFAMTPGIRRWSDLSVMLVSSVVYAVLAYVTWGKAFKEASTGTLVEIGTLMMPVWHSYFLPPIGFTLGCIACLITALCLVLPGAADTLEETLDGH